ERAGDRRSRAELALQHDDVPGRGDCAAELAEHGVQRLFRIGSPNGLRQHVPGPPELVMRLLEPELTDVARDRRLCDSAAGLAERIEQLELRADALAGDDALDQAVPLGLSQLHKTSIRMQGF